MHLWAIEPLELALSRNEISDRESLHYYAVNSVVALIVSEYSLWWGPHSGWLFYSEFLVLLLLTVWGLLGSWNANGGMAGRDIVLRIVCLSVPVGIRTSLLGIGAGLTLYIFSEDLLGGGTFQNPDRAHDFLSYGIFVAVAFLYWKMLVASIKRTATRSADG